MKNNFTKMRMNKLGDQTFLKIAFILCVLSVNNLKAQVYCSPSFGGTACSIPPFLDFSLSSASFSGTTFCTNVPCPANYGDYFATYTANLNAGTPYALTVNYNNSADASVVSFSIYCGAWIDWNNDGTFDDATERIMTTNVGPAGATTQTGVSFTPTAVGTFRMRVIMQTGLNPTNPCTTGGGENGEAKDFKVVVASSVGLNDISNENFINIYPNPSNLNGVYFKFNTLNNKLLTIKLIDLLGKTVEQKVVFAKTTGEQQFIDFNDVTSGIYNIEITDGNAAQRIKLILTQD